MSREDLMTDQLSRNLGLVRRSFLPKESCEGVQDSGGEYSKHISLIEDSLQELRAIISDIEEVHDTQFLIELIALCGENYKHSPWTSLKAYELANEITSLVCRLMDCTLQGLFTLKYVPEYNDPLGIVILQFLRPKLLKDSWVYYPGAVSCYVWILHNIKGNHMTNFKNIVFPTALNILDHYLVSNKVIGIQCLSHVLQQLDVEELNQYCSPHALFDILKPLLYRKECDLIIPLVRCILELVWKSHGKAKTTLQWSALYDDTLSVLLPIVEFEQNIDLCLKYIEALHIVFSHPVTGLSIARWDQRVLSIVSAYCTVPVTADWAFKVLFVYLSKCYPLIRNMDKSLPITVGKFIMSTENVQTLNTSCDCYSIIYEVMSPEMKMPTVEELREHRKRKTESKRSMK